MNKHLMCVGAISSWLPSASRFFHGLVVGVYQHGCYVRETQGSRLWYIGCQRASPVTVNALLLEASVWRVWHEWLQPSQVVSYSGTQLRLYGPKGMLLIQFSQLTIVPTRVRSALSNEHLEHFVEWCPFESLLAVCGLNPAAKQQLEHDVFLTPHHVESCLLSLIGRGSGLTPAGDDVLFGYCFLKSMQTASFDWVAPIAQKVKRASTTVSYQFFSALAQGYASQALLALNEGLNSPQQWERLRYYFEQYGHTSGNDVLLGISCYVNGVKQNEGNKN